MANVNIRLNPAQLMIMATELEAIVTDNKALRQKPEITMSEFKMHMARCELGNNIAVLLKQHKQIKN